ncbi:hypothetical protein [Sphingomonas mesophila]|uniref:hypothetical protein n=1 Tax=Sphingomonas mesophila TaxID=2303576 RepID=UPI0013C2E6D4|nr:hypothetical protein [Sphingomonas mesophila]
MPTRNDTNDRKTNRDEGLIESARERAVDAYDSAREAARRAGRSAGEQFDEAPLIALGGGLALGALIAALLPTTRRERELLGPVTDRIKDSAAAAADAAREAGSTRLGELGLTRDRGGDVLRQVVDGAADALRASAKAAATAVRER